MKKIIIALIACLVCIISSNAQNKTGSASQTANSKELILSPKDSLMFKYFNAYLNQLREPRFQLYKTKNIWTFIKLDTMTGQLWQVQYSINNDNAPRMETILDDNIRIFSWHEPICGRFTLYQTENIYNFILLDTIDGRCWQVQWNIDYDNRGVMRIL